MAAKTYQELPPVDPERVHNARIARDTLAILRRGVYCPLGSLEPVEIGAQVRWSTAKTTVFPARTGSLRDTPARAGVLEVTGESTLAAARRLTEAGGTPVAVLNFAEIEAPGGGFLSGAKAQEEYLCRSSALYASLAGRTMGRGFYGAHWESGRGLLGSDLVAYTPGVVVLRDDAANLVAPWSVNVLTAAAPRAGELAKRGGGVGAALLDEALAGVLCDRARQIVEVAVVRGVRTLVLGAWGCGAFGCDPRMVAGAFAVALTGPAGLAGRFDRVVFAIRSGTARSDANLAVFRQVLAPGLSGGSGAGGAAALAF